MSCCILARIFFDRFWRITFFDDFTTGLGIERLDLLDEVLLAHTTTTSSDREANAIVVIIIDNGRLLFLLSCVFSRFSTFRRSGSFGRTSIIAVVDMCPSTHTMQSSTNRCWFSSARRPLHATSLLVWAWNIIFLHNFTILVFHNDCITVLVSVSRTTTRFPRGLAG